MATVYNLWDRGVKNISFTASSKGVLNPGRYKCNSEKNSPDAESIILIKITTYVNSSFSDMYLPHVLILGI